jgi:hypothetical protein
VNTLNLDRDKCKRRNRLAGLRGNVETTPLRFLRADQLRVVTASGALPKDDEAALELINSKIPGTLSSDQVYIHYMEAGSTRYIDDRHAFLDPSTLKRIVKCAADGFAFMNSHRTGDVSTPSELPFGRTFVGQLQTVRDDAGNSHKAAILGVYMLRGEMPNGANGPSTDAIHAGINGGTMFDVSLGLYGGWKKCDVCQQDLYGVDQDGNYICPHVPGSTRKMNKDQINAQKVRGVDTGCCTYSIMDATANEVSAVYDGAIPGAGFRKARDLARSQNLSRSLQVQFSKAYPGIFKPQKEFGMRVSLASLMNAFRQNPNQTVEIDDVEDLDGAEFGPRTLAPARVATRLSVQETDASGELARLRAENERLNREAAERSEREAAEAAERDRLEAERFATALVAGNSILPAEKDHYQRLYLQLATDDRANPLKTGNRLAMFTALTGARPKHKLTTDLVASNPGVKQAFSLISPDAPSADEDAANDLSKLRAATKKAMS